MGWERLQFISLYTDLPFHPLHADQCDIWTGIIPILSDDSIRASYYHGGSVQLRQHEGGQEEKEMQE